MNYNRAEKSVLHLNPYKIDNVGGVEVHLRFLFNVWLTDPQFAKWIFEIATPQESYISNHIRCDYLSPKNPYKADGLELETQILDLNLTVFHNGHMFLGDKIKQVRDKYKPRNAILEVHNLSSRDSNSWDILNEFEGQIVVYSEFMKEVIKSQISRDALILPYHFPYIDSSKQPKTQYKQFKILQPTRFANWKGSHYSLLAIVKLLDSYPNIFFEHAGTDFETVSKTWDQRWSQNYPDLYEKVRVYYRKGRIKFSKYTPSEILEVISDADLILHPTTGIGADGEPFSISAAQSIIANKPIIVSDSGNLPHLVGSYSKGVIISVDKLGELDEMLENQIQNLNKDMGPTLNDTKLATTLIENAENAPRTHFDLYKQITN